MLAAKAGSPEGRVFAPGRLVKPGHFAERQRVASEGSRSGPLSPVWDFARSPRHGAGGLGGGACQRDRPLPPSVSGVGAALGSAKRRSPPDIRDYPLERLDTRISGEAAAFTLRWLNQRSSRVGHLQSYLVDTCQLARPELVVSAAGLGSRLSLPRCDQILRICPTPETSPGR